MRSKSLGAKNILDLVHLTTRGMLPSVRRQGRQRMKMNTYVNFAGTCAEAFRFYEKQLGGNISMMMTHGQAPDQSQVRPEWKDAVLHARITLGGEELMGAGSV